MHRLVAALIALAAWAGLIVQCAATFGQTGSVPETLWIVLRFFTVITNLLVAIIMAPIAARKATQIARNAAGVIAVELIAAAQGVDYHSPLKTGAKLQAVHAKVREISSRFTSDRYWADDMAALQAAVLAGEIGGEVISLS